MNATCSIAGCDRQHQARGWCMMHYLRWHRHGDPLVVRARPSTVKTRGICSIDDCHKPHEAHGWCTTHYTRWRRHGDPLATKSRRGMSDEDRFWSRVRGTTVDQCWIWTGALTTGGYGSFFWNGRVGYAHRFSYESIISDIPHELELDHHCQTQRCVNPWHLEPVTSRVNKQRISLRKRAA